MGRGSPLVKKMGEPAPGDCANHPHDGLGRKKRGEATYGRGRGGEKGKGQPPAGGGIDWGHEKRRE